MFKKAKKLSLRRSRRKLKKDGFKSLIKNASTTIGREFILSPIIKILIRNGVIPVYNINCLESIPEKIYYIEGYRSEFHRTPELPFVATFPNGYVCPKYGILLDNKKKIINPVLQPREGDENVIVSRINRMIFNNPVLFTNIICRNSSQWTDSTQYDMVAPLFPYYINYYHWMIKTLPKVRYINNYSNKIGENIKFMLPQCGPDWMDETLNLLNVPEEDIIYPNDSLYKVKNLIAPSWVALSVDDFRWLKETMLEPCRPDDQQSTNILISREDATDRHIINQDEVANVLKKYGFEKVVLSEISVKESIHLFNQADMIVGAHGAGFADIVFAEDASVIELHGSRYTSTYKNISQRLGLDYTRIQCDPVFGDLMVDTDKLEAVIQNKINQ